MALRQRSVSGKGQMVDVALYEAVFNMMESALPEFKVPGVIPKLSETPGDLEWVGPEPGEHTAEVLSSCGYSESEVAGLRVRKVV